MKFVYHYRTSDNCLREGVVRATTREGVYDVLRKQGIRPSRVELAPGFLNGLIWHLHSSAGVLLIAFLLIVSIVGFILYFQLQDSGEILPQNRYLPTVRHQIYGDPALIAKWDRDGFANVFESDGERFLARFAQPGKLVEGLEVTEVDRSQVSSLGDSLTNCLGVPVKIQEDDPREVVELKQIIQWMKNEMREFLSAGETSEEYVRQLILRQRKEREVLEFTKSELSGVRDAAVWDAKNAALRRLGLPTIPVPEDIE